MGAWGEFCRQAVDGVNKTGQFSTGFRQGRVIPIKKIGSSFFCYFQNEQNSGIDTAKRRTRDGVDTAKQRTATAGACWLCSVVRTS